MLAAIFHPERSVIFSLRKITPVEGPLHSSVPSHMPQGILTLTAHPSPGNFERNSSPSPSALLPAPPEVAGALLLPDFGRRGIPHSQPLPTTPHTPKLSATDATPPDTVRTLAWCCIDRSLPSRAPPSRERCTRYLR